MKHKTLSLAMTTMSLLAISCSSGFKRPESIEEKMARFKAKNIGQNFTPSYKVANVDFTKKARGRGPASVGKKNTGESNISNKRLYFLSLHNQYQQLKQYVSSDSAPTLNICPRFHTSLVKYKETYGDQPYKTKVYSPKFTVSQLGDADYSAKYPELYLPVSKDGKTPTVMDMVSKTENKKVEEVVKEAIKVHLSKTYIELKELCDYGSSDNYYVYENLLTHIQRKDEGWPASNDNMTVLLKTTLVGNMALIRSLEYQSKAEASRGIASVNNEVYYDDEVLDRMNADWSKDYFDSMVSNR